MDYKAVSIILIPFSSAVLYQVTVNGPHIGCCHTVRSVTSAILLMGVVLTLITAVLTILANYVLKLEGNLFIGLVGVMNYCAYLIVRRFEDYNYNRIRESFVKLRPN